MTPQEALSGHVIDVPDFPQPGVVFKDIAPLLGDPAAFATVVAALADAGRGEEAAPVDKVVGMESRGFILGAPVALALGAGFVPVRKAGKLPRAVHAESYALEYGQATLEIQVDAIAPGERVLLVDDVLATGGTARATRDLVRACGGEVTALSVLIELGFLDGRAQVPDLEVFAVTTIA